MSGVFPYMVRVEEYVVNIRPLDYENAIMYFTDVKGSLFEIPTETEIRSFEYKNKGSVNQSTVETDLNVEPGTRYFPLKMENSYIIHYNGYILLEGGKSVNGGLYELADMFEYPPSHSETDAYNESRFTSLVKASTTKGSDMVKVSSTKGIEIDKMVEGQGIPEYSWVVYVDYDDLVIHLNQLATQSLSNITFNIRNMSPDDEEFMYE
jgi:hypothetical protein